MDTSLPGLREEEQDLFARLTPVVLFFSPEWPARATVPVLSGQPSPLRVFSGLLLKSGEASGEGVLRSSLLPSHMPLSPKFTDHLAVCTGLTPIKLIPSDEKAQ